MLDEPFMRRVSPEFQDDPLRYISMGWGTGGAMNTFRDDDIHTLINYLPVAAQRFCYREYESQCEQEEEEDSDSDYDEEEDEGVSALAGARTLTAEPEFETDDESDHDSMPELLEEEFDPSAPQAEQWSFVPGHDGTIIEICDLSNSIQV